MRTFRLLGSAALALLARAEPGSAQQPVAVHPLGVITGSSTEAVGNSLRILSDGRVLVNDLARRRLVMLDASLAHAVVVADTTTATGKAYGQGLNGLIPFVGDSSLAQDQITGAYVVLDPHGKIARIIPKLGLTINAGPPVGSDQAGRLLFRAAPPIFLTLLDASFVGDTLMAGPDSNPVFRTNLATHRVDTVAMLQAARLKQSVTRRGAGLGGAGRPAFNPIKAGDDWVLLNDGTIAVVRVSDYHIDWVAPNGRVTAGPKIPTQWVRITDARKVAIMDSVRRVGAGATPNQPVMPAGNPTPGGVPVRPAAVRALAAAPAAYVLPSDLPDFQPPFVLGATLSDGAGNVWVRVNPDLGSTVGTVYDVISRTGGLMDRVQIPAGTTVVGFGTGVVYVVSGAGATSRLSKVLIH